MILMSIYKYIQRILITYNCVFCKYPRPILKCDTLYILIKSEFLMVLVYNLMPFQF